MKKCSFQLTPSEEHGLLPSLSSLYNIITAFIIIISGIISIICMVIIIMMIITLIIIITKISLKWAGWSSRQVCFH